MEPRYSAAFAASVFRCGLLVIFIGAAPVLAQSGTWKPNKNVELIAAVSAGGVPDRIARTIQRAWQQENIVNVTSSIVNKPGGGGAIAWSYLNQHRGEGHYLAITSPGLVINYLLGRTGLKYTDFTSIALLDSDYIVYAVKKDSPINTGRDLVDRLRRDPASVAMSIGIALGNSNHIATAQIFKKAGGIDIKKLKLVIFNSASEATTAVLGGHIDVTIVSIGPAVSQIAAGNLKGIAVAAPERIGGPLANAPTWKELGVDVVAATWHGVIGPKGMTPAQLAYWEAVFFKLVQTEEWKKDLDRYMLSNTYMNSKDSTRFLDGEHERYKAALAELGMLK